MNPVNLTFKTTAVIAALTLTAFAAPNALAGDGAYSKASSRLVNSVAARTASGEHSTQGFRNRGDRGSNRGSNRGSRSDRHRTRGHNSRGTRTRDYVHLRGGGNYRGGHDSRRDQGYRGRGYTNRGYGNRGYGSRNGFYRSSFGNNSFGNSSFGSNSWGNYRRGRGYRHNGYSSPYRSNVGISFSFGSPGYSSYRWASARDAFYRPGRMSRASYSAGTQCERVTVDGFQYGTMRPVTVTQCYNPWDGYYILQGSERIAHTSGHRHW